jgi:predicted transcriptional regulator
VKVEELMVKNVITLQTNTSVYEALKRERLHGEFVFGSATEKKQ